MVGATGTGCWQKSIRRHEGLWRNANLRTQLERIIRRAGLNASPKLFQNLRSTRETELVPEFPLHVVTAWLGKTAGRGSKALFASHGSGL